MDDLVGLHVDMWDYITFLALSFPNCQASRSSRAPA
jgi:hypothetical protein